MKKLFLSLGLMVMSAAAIGYTLPAGYVEVPNPEKVLDIEIYAGEELQMMENKATGGRITIYTSVVEGKIPALTIAEKSAPLLQCNDDDYDVDGDDDEAYIKHCIIDGVSHDRTYVERENISIWVDVTDKVTKDELNGVLKEIKSKYKK